MRKIFAGLLFIFLDFNLNLGAVQIELIPDFAGYLIMLAGLGEMAAFSPRFGKMKPFAIGLAIYTGALFALDLLGVTTWLISYSNLSILPLALPATLAYYYVLYNIIQGVAQIEADRRQDLGSRTLHVIWLVYAAFTALAFVPFLALPALIGGFIAAICFLVTFYGTMKRFYTP